jgi:hypothetical protein
MNIAGWTMVEHEPEWEPADLPVDSAGNTRPGFICVHELENGAGQCLGNVFQIEDSIGTHCCMIRKGGPKS